MHELRHPATARPGQSLTLAMKWQNTGSAPCYRPYRLAYRLTNPAGYDRTLVGSVTVETWMPGSVELFTDEFMKSPPDLPPGDLVDATDSVTVPANTPPGTYRLAIAAVGTEGTKPLLRFAIKGRDEDGWYPLGDLTIADAN